MNRSFTLLAFCSSFVAVGFSQNYLGDVNKDTEIDVEDVVTLTNMILNQESPEVIYGNFIINSLSFDKAFEVLPVGVDYELHLTQEPVYVTNATLSWASSNAAVATVDNGVVTTVGLGRTVITVSTANGVTATIEVIVAEETTNHAYVDLGLSVMWASTNVGGATSRSNGYYYAWGEIHGSSADTSRDYSWKSYQYTSSTTSSWAGANKYQLPDGQLAGIWYQEGEFVGDNKKYLEPGDDVAHYAWGGLWRIPTYAEQTELRNNCYWEWTDGYNGTEVPGFIVYKVKNTKDKGLCSFDEPKLSAKYTLKDTHIFMSAAGYKGHAKLYDHYSYGQYWSNTLGENGNDCAYGLYFRQTNIYHHGSSRFVGRTIRPVCNVKK